MNRPASSQPLGFFIWLYIGLGLGSIAVGAYLLVFPRVFVGSTQTSDPMQNVIATILIGFGIVRIVLAVLKLRNLARRAK